MRVGATATFTPGDVSGILTEIGAAVVAGVTDAGQQALALEQSYTPVATGALRDSETCEVTEEATGVTANIGPRGIPYDVYVEFGTGKRGASSPDAGPEPYDENWPGMTPQPYARPMLDEIGPQVLDIVGEAVKGVL